MDPYLQSSPIRITRPKTPRGRHAPSSSIDYPQDAFIPRQSSSRTARPSTSSRTLAKKISKPRLLSKASEPTMPFSFQSPRPAPPLPSPLPPRPRTPAPTDQPATVPPKSATPSKSRFRKHRRAKSFGTSDSRADTTQDSDESSILCSSAAEFDESLARHDRVLAAERRRKGLDPDPYRTPEERKQRQLWAGNLFEKLTKRIGETRFIKEIYRKREKSSSLGHHKDFDLHPPGARSSNGTNKSFSSGPGESSSSHQATASQGHSSFSSPHSSASAGYPRLPGNFSWSDSSQSPETSISHGSSRDSKGKTPQRDPPAREPIQTQPSEGPLRPSKDLVRKHALSGPRPTRISESSNSPSNARKGTPSNTSNSSHASNPSSDAGKRPANAPGSSRSIQHARSRSLSNASHRQPRSEPPAAPLPPVPGRANQMMQTSHRLPQRLDHESSTLQVPEQFQDAVMPQTTINTPGFSSDWHVRSSLTQSESATRRDSLADPAIATPRHSDPFAFTGNDAGNSNLTATYRPGLGTLASQQSQLSNNGVRDTFGGLQHEDSMMLDDLITQAEQDLNVIPERGLLPLAVDPLATSPLTCAVPSERRPDSIDAGLMPVASVPRGAVLVGAVEGEAWAKPALYYEEAAETSKAAGTLGARLASRLRTLGTTANSSRTLTAKKRSQRFLARQPRTKLDPLADAIIFSEPQEPVTQDLAALSMTASDSAKAILSTGAPHNGSLDSVATAASSIFDVGEAASAATPTSSTSDFADPRSRGYY